MAGSKPVYRAELVHLEGGGLDVRVKTPEGKSWSMWGRRGRRREEDLAASAPEGRLPVLLGSGLGRCLELLLDRGPAAVVDAESPILEVSGVRDRFAQRIEAGELLWIEDRDVEQAAARLEAWRKQHGGARLTPLAPPLYRRLDPRLYPLLEARLSHDPAEAEALFWRRATYPKFQGVSRVLLLSTPYFLYREIREALGRLGAEVRDLEVGRGETVREGFVEDLLRGVLDFRPDFVLTVNHLGVDREGALTSLLERLSLPLASWFVDSPHLILHRYQGLSGRQTAVFSWDESTVAPLKRQGFGLVRWLPLATDERIFKPGLAPLPKSLQGDAGFVGDSMVSKAAERLEHAAPPGILAQDYQELAAGFALAEEASPAEYLARAHPEHAGAFEALSDNERKLSFEALLTWEATRAYRLDCVRGLAGFDAVVAGDEHWPEALPDAPGLRFAPRLDYYADLPRFYPGITVNLNCTSRQMKSAVNQRIFDVPACGGFVLTDRQGQLDRLLEPGREVAVFERPDEIPELVRRYLGREDERRRIIEAGRARVLAEHTYERRLAELLSEMKASFG